MTRYEITKQATDDSVLAELGGRLARIRLDRNLTQAQLAEQAGVSKRTIERLEAEPCDAIVGIHPRLSRVGCVGTF